MDASTSGAVTASFTIADTVVVVGYLLAMVGVGLYMSRGQKSTRDYFLGGRNISWWAVGLAIIATETSALTFIGVPAMAFGAMSRNAAGRLVVGQGNIGYLQIIIGYVIARIIVAIMMVPHYFKGDVYSPYQILMKNFGKGPRYLASWLFLIGGSLGAGVRIYVTAIPVMILFRVFYPGWGILESIMLFTIISIIYTYIGGIKAVVWTDVIQFGIFVIGGIFALLYIPSLLKGGLGEMWRVGKETGRLEWINDGVVSIKEFKGAGGQGFWSFIWVNIKEIFSGGGKFNIWMGLIGATIGVMCSHGVDQLNVQRVLTCRSAREGKKALILSAVLIGPLFFIFLFVGVALYAFYSANGFNFGINPWDPTVAGSAPKADFVFPIFIITHVPPLLKGLLIAGILAAAMSSISGALSALGSVGVMDIYRQFDLHSLEKKPPKVRIESSSVVGRLIAVNVVIFFLAILFKWASPFKILKDFLMMYKNAFIQIGRFENLFLVSSALLKILAWPGLNVLGFFFIKDLYKPRGEKYYLRLSRWAVIWVSFILILIAYLSQYATLVFNLAFTLAGLTSGALLGSILFAIWHKRSYPGPVIAGMVTSVLAMTGIVIVVRTTRISINWPWFTPIGTAVTLMVCYLGSIGVPKPEKDFAEDIKPIKPKH